MTNQVSNNKRIAKNTLLLYLRMLFIMGVSLYTSRIILQVLGIEDFGIQNVVGGIVAMFGFISGSMATATQRFLTYALGQNDQELLKKTFSMSVNVHIIIALIIVLLSETIGLWFFYNKMNIPEEREFAAACIYQISILTSVILIISVPYNACIIAHEKMRAFAYISVFDVSVKLIIVYLLKVSTFDKLIVYSILLLMTQLLTRLIYTIYCKNKFEETHYHFYKDKSLFFEFFNFAGWISFGYIAGVTLTQGLNILLNIFFGPIVNAARAITVQVQQAILNFSNNFQQALNPQIIKSYASKDIGRMHELLFASSKYSYYLLLFISVPVLFECEFLLSIWLTEVPMYTISFIRIILFISMIDAISNPIVISAAATGNVKKYQIVVSSVLLTVLPLSYVALKMGWNADSVFSIHLVIAFIAHVVRLFMIRPLIKLSLKAYFVEVIMRITLVTICAIPFPLIAYYVINDNLLRFLLVCFSSFSSVVLSIYLLGLNAGEKIFIREKIEKKFFQKKLYD